MERCRSRSGERARRSGERELGEFITGWKLVLAGAFPHKEGVKKSGWRGCNWIRQLQSEGILLVGSRCSWSCGCDGVFAAQGNGNKRTKDVIEFF